MTPETSFLRGGAVTVGNAQETLRLGKGALFVKTHLKRLHQEDETWEADFRALPKGMMQSTTQYLGMVVTEPDGFLLAEQEIENKPGVNDLATLLAQAMRRPLTTGGRRPTRIHLRGHRQWQQLFPHLKELGIEVIVQNELPQADDTFNDYLRHMQKSRRRSMVPPTSKQISVERFFPAIARWVADFGHIEIGDQQSLGFVARALDYGGLVFEDDKPDTLAEAMATLEKGLAQWFHDQEIEIG
jgi:hypothetical protein